MGIISQWARILVDLVGAWRKSQKSEGKSQKEKISLKAKLYRKLNILTMRTTIFITIMILFSVVACDSASDKQESNPLLAKWETPHQTPPFGEIKNEHFIPAIDEALVEAKEEVDAIISNKAKPSFENTIVALDKAGEKLSSIKSVLFNLNSAETSEEIQSIARDVSPKLTEFGNYISLNEKLFEKVSSIYNKRESLNLNPEQTRLLEKNYKGFVRNGANLKGEAKTRYAEITTELSKLSLKFGENVLAETNAYILHITDEKDLSGLPDPVKEAAAQLAKSKEKEGWMFNLQFPSYGPFLKYADNRKLREKIYRASSARGFQKNDNNNEQVIHDIVGLRMEKARLLGFDSHADYVLEERMAETLETVAEFIGKLHEASRPAAVKDYSEVQKIASKSGLNSSVERWDWMYYSEKLKTEKYGFDEQELKPYFQLEKVQDGVFDLAKKLYGLDFKINKSIPVYNEDVNAYEVYDEDGSFLSVLYLDFFPREGKRSGAWMTSFRPQSNIDGEMIRPIISIVCNFTKPTETKPSLLTFNEVTTFLHEFGHALHGIFANTVYSSLSGTSVYWDFVELPSQIMENWAVEKEWLDLFTVHYESGEKIPEDLVAKLIEARNFQSGYMSDRQLSLGMVDMAWHSITEPVSGGIVEFEKKAMESTELFPKIEGACFCTAFSHIFAGGYSAGYYSYKWAEVLDADAFSLFKENGIFDKQTAKMFRDEILSKGGTEHPMKLYKAFRGQEPNTDALLERSGLKK
jgi:peptidyl-dipeptidase Dcp